MRLWLVIPLALGACKMGNPAFELMEGDSSGGSGDAGVDDGASGDHGDDGGGGTGGGGSGGDTDATDNDGGDGQTGGDGSSSGDEDSTGGVTTTAPTCDYGRTPPLDIKLGSGPQDACADDVASHFKVLGHVANGWSVERCFGDSCSNCDPAEIHEFTAWPLKPQDVINPINCFWLDLESNYDDTDGCRYEGVTAWRQGEPTETPVLVGSTRSYGTPVGAANPLGGFAPELSFLWECDCSEVDDVPMCCPDEPPSAWGFDTQGMITKPGEVAYVHLGYDQKEFQFHNVQSYGRGICGTAINEAWALVRE